MICDTTYTRPLCDKNEGRGEAGGRSWIQKLRPDSETSSIRKPCKTNDSETAIRKPRFGNWRFGNRDSETAIRKPNQPIRKPLCMVRKLRTGNWPAGSQHTASQPSVARRPWCSSVAFRPWCSGLPFGPWPGVALNTFLLCIILYYIIYCYIILYCIILYIIDICFLTLSAD